jgi:hypothetical protein
MGVPNWKGPGAGLRSSLDWWDYVAAPLTLAAGAAAVYCGPFIARPSPPGGIYGWWLTAQIAATLIAAGLPTYSAIRAKRRELRAAQREIDARTQARVEMNEAIDPIIRTLASSAGGDVVGLRRQVLSLVTKTAAEIIGPEHGTRACYFDAKQGPPKRLMPTQYRAGRLGSTRSEFVEGTDAGDAAIAMVQSGGHLLCVDTDAEPPPGWHNIPRDYKTFISVAVVAGDTAYGMLTVDAPSPGDLNQRDVDLLTVMAGLVALAMRLES